MSANGLQDFISLRRRLGRLGSFKRTSYRRTVKAEIENGKSFPLEGNHRRLCQAMKGVQTYRQPVYLLACSSVVVLHLTIPQQKQERVHEWKHCSELFEEAVPVVAGSVIAGGWVEVPVGHLQVVHMHSSGALLGSEPD